MADTPLQRSKRKATQRAARMQIMREWMQQYSYEKSNFFDNSCWHDFVKAHPEAADWFDEDGLTHALDSDDDCY